MSFKFWSDKEVKIVKNYTAKECIKHNLLPGRTASMIGAKRNNLVNEGISVYKKKYEPIKSIEKNNSSIKTLKLYTAEEDEIIKNNDPKTALSLLSGRDINSIYQRKAYLKRNNLFNNKATNKNINTQIKSTNKDLNLTINEIELKVTNVKAIWIDKNNIDIKTH